MNKFYILLILFNLALAPYLLFGNNINKKNDSIKVVNYFNAGVELTRQGLYSEAIDSLLVSLELGKKIYGNNNYHLANTYRYIGVNYNNIGMYDLAIQNSKRAEMLYIQKYGEKHIRVASVYQNLGNIYRAKLNYIEALDYFERMIFIIQNQKNTNLQQIAAAYYSIAEVYYLMYQYVDAIEIINKNINNAATPVKIYYLELLGAIYQETNNLDKAKIYYEEAIQQSMNLYSENDIEVAIEYINYALFLNNTNKFDEAIDILEKAYSILMVTENNKGKNIADYYRIYGTIYEDRNIESTNIGDFKNQKYLNYEEAIKYFKRALIALDFPMPLKPQYNYEEVNNISILYILDLLKKIADDYVAMALIFEGEKNDIYQESLLQSLDYYEIISQLLQRTKKEITDDDSKILLSGLEQSTFIKLIQTSFRAYETDHSAEHIERAFKNAELLKSGSLFEKLSNDEAMKSSLIPDSLLEKEQKINASITTYNEIKYNEELTEAPNPAEIARLDSILFNLRRQRTELNDYLEKNYSQYYNLKYSDNSIPINVVQNNLKSNEVLIEYVLNETDSVSELYSFFFSKEEIQFNCQKLTKTFSKNIDDMFHFMSNSNYMFTKNEDSQKFSRASAHLYEKLIAPYENKIRDKNLIIIPDGKLSYISFDALLTELPDTTEIIHFNKLSYLIKSNCINYSYSANLLYIPDYRKKESQKKILAFAPKYETDSITIGSEVFPLRPLLGTQKEVDLIASEIKTEVFKGKDATELNFRENSENFDILHLAMHAFINDSLPSLSQFAFSQNKTGDLNSDGLFSTADIYNLNLNARLSVLSACNTGTGQLKKGEGVISLARGFLYAGCPSIVMTLWEVEDNSGTKIMSTFYKYLKKGKNKDEALRLAKLEYLENANSRLAHPHYWLGYVSIGKNTPLYRSYDFYFFGLLLLIIVGVITEQVVRIKKARNKQASR
jgi:CHAT domain-containing protein/tetratricopeptide (TPR) repeat protein